MTKDQEERLVNAWEGIAKGLGDLHELARTAIGKQWPDARPVREAVVSKLPTPEEKAKQRTGNSAGPVDEWINEFGDPEKEDQEELGPREKAFLAGQGKKPSGSKASS